MQNIAKGYKKVIADLYSAGCRNLQFDDCSSCEIGNKLSEEQQWAKLALVKEIADEVWG